MKKILPLLAFIIIAAAILYYFLDSNHISLDDKNSEATLTTIRVGYIPIAHCALLAESEIFAKHGLELRLVRAAGGAVILNSLITGSVDIGFSNLVSPVIAYQSGARLQSIGPANYENKEHAEHALLVPEDSEIEDAKDLIGKRIAINTRRNIDHLMLLSFLNAKGLDESDVELIEVPFPRMIPVLRNGDVSAAAAVEPFVTLGETQGLKSLGSYYAVEPGEDVFVASFFANKEWISANRSEVKAFNNAVREVLSLYIQEPDYYRAAIADFTGLEGAVIDKMLLPKYRENIQTEEYKELINRMIEYQFIKSNLPPDQLIFDRQE